MRSLNFLIKPFIDYVFKIKGYPKFSYHILFPLILITVFYMGISVEKVSPLIQVGMNTLSFMSAFSFAALISLPTLNSKTLNKKMYGNRFNSSEVKPIELSTVVKGIPSKVHLTRKDFLSVLLGYICFMSIFMLLALFFVKMCHFEWLEAYWLGFKIFFNIIVPFFLLWGIFSLIINVLYAIHYFTKIDFDE
jgi:hypothetical protein